MLKTRKAKGFTLVELLVTVVIMGVLAAVALPNFVAAMQSASSCAVKGSMRTIQIASESYATSSGGGFAADCGPGGCGPFLPGGDNSIGGTPGSYPGNSVTGAAGVVPVPQGIATINAISQMRNAVASSTPCAAGIGGITYDQVSGGASYAVTGGDANGKCVSGTNGTVLVLSNE